MAIQDLKKTFKELDHTGDLRVEIYGDGVEDLFLNAVHALYAMLGLPKQREHAQGRGGETLKVLGQDWEDALVRLLGELLYRFEAEKLRFSAVRVLVNRDPGSGSVSVRVRGRWRPLSPRERLKGREIKAVTYHDTEIRRGRQGLVARVVMDI